MLFLQFKHKMDKDNQSVNSTEGKEPLIAKSDTTNKESNEPEMAKPPAIAQPSTEVKPPKTAAPPKVVSKPD